MLRRAVINQWTCIYNFLQELLDALYYFSHYNIFFSCSMTGSMIKLVHLLIAQSFGIEESFRGARPHYCINLVFFCPLQSGMLRCSSSSYAHARVSWRTYRLGVDSHMISDQRGHLHESERSTDGGRYQLHVI